MLGRRAFNVCFLFLAFLAFYGGNQAAAGGSDFVKASGNHFVVNNKAFYLNGFNAYWLMYMASDPNERGKVTTAFQQASKSGMTVARTWAFSDGGNRPLQYKPGSYNEEMFKGLDFVISEAQKSGVYLILSFVNNYEDFGGRKQYVQWARDQGIYLNSDDDFYRHPVVKGFYKNHVKTVLTRINSITGVAYKDDPTIFAWELMNEPRCQSDLSGNTIQEWIKEMAVHVKSIDRNHLLEVGLEGFYGESIPDRKQFNPGYEVGSDFISNNQIPGIDFATIHAYPDQWVPGSNDQAQAAFLKRWLQSHIQDANAVLRKPILVAEFGKSLRNSGSNIIKRDSLMEAVYDEIYGSAKKGGPCCGGLFWHLLVPGMENFSDGYEIVMPQSPSTANIIAQQSNKVSALNV